MHHLTTFALFESGGVTFRAYRYHGAVNRESWMLRGGTYYTPLGSDQGERYNTDAFHLGGTTRVEVELVSRKQYFLYTFSGTMADFANKALAMKMLPRLDDLLSAEEREVLLTAAYADERQLKRLIRDGEGYGEVGRSLMLKQGFFNGKMMFIEQVFATALRSKGYDLLVVGRERDEEITELFDVAQIARVV